MEKKQVWNVSVLREEPFRDAPAHLDPDEEDRRMGLCKGCQQFPLPAAEIEPDLALPQGAIGFQPVTGWTATLT